MSAVEIADRANFDDLLGDLIPEDDAPLFDALALRDQYRSLGLLPVRKPTADEETWVDPNGTVHALLPSLEPRVTVCGVTEVRVDPDSVHLRSCTSCFGAES